MAIKYVHNIYPRMSAKGVNYSRCIIYVRVWSVDILSCIWENVVLSPLSRCPLASDKYHVTTDS